ncbi:MAG: cyclic lactone autoinducer peptide [Lachnospiraceae bacterium]|nr:cyclic lactone autoinducer peptide [Lachnospiraceae bacterium]
MKQLSHVLAVIGKQAAKHAVCATSTDYCYQPKEPKAAREKYQK